VKVETACPPDTVRKACTVNAGIDGMAALAVEILRHSRHCQPAKDNGTDEERFYFPKANQHPSLSSRNH
jgi:hypothetical protein